MKYSLLMLLTIILVSCAPKFEVNNTNTSEYSEFKNSIVYKGKNNFLTNNSSDILLNPIVIKDNSTQEIKNISLELYSKANEKYQFGMIKSISISDNSSNTILLNSDNFISKPYVYMKNGKQIKTNEVIETCLFTIDKSQFENMINSNDIEIKINGDKKDYRILTQNISKNFLVNLKSFYHSYILKIN